MRLQSLSNSVVVCCRLVLPLLTVVELPLLFIRLRVSCSAFSIADRSSFAPWSTYATTKSITTTHITHSHFLLLSSAKHADAVRRCLYPFYRVCRHLEAHRKARIAGIHIALIS